MTTRWVLSLVCGCWLGLAVGTAEAQPFVDPPDQHLPPGLTPGVEPNHQPGPSTEWYGWQIMLSDLATVASAAASENGALGLLGYLAAPAVIHAAHGEAGKAVGSPLLRFGLPLAGGLIGYQIGCSGDSGGQSLCGLAALPGIGLGILGAVITDWTWARRKRARRSRGLVVAGRCQGPGCKSVGYAMAW